MDMDTHTQTNQQSNKQNCVSDLPLSECGCVVGGGGGGGGGPGWGSFDWRLMQVSPGDGVTFTWGWQLACGAAQGGGGGQAMRP